MINTRSTMVVLGVAVEGLGECLAKEDDVWLDKPTAVLLATAGDLSVEDVLLYLVIRELGLLFDTTLSRKANDSIRMFNIAIA